MSQKQVQVYPGVLLNKSANSVSVGINVADFKNASFAVIAAALSNYNIEVLGSLQELGDVPDPSVASAIGNQWAPVGYVDLDTGTNYSSSSLYNPGGAAASKQFAVNTDGLTWLFIKISTYVAGTLTAADVTLFNNQ